MQNCVDVWTITLPIDYGSFLTLNENLSHKELEEIKLFKTQELKYNASVSRGGLREILSKYLDIDPKLINIQKNQFGKPYVPDSNIYFNVSHAGKYIVIAISANTHLGVDIERIVQDFDYLDIMKNYFTVNECISISSQTTNIIQAFYRGWTRKEACLKAVGRGLSIDLKNIEVTCCEKLPPMVTKFEEFPNNWQLFEIDYDQEYMLSLALQSTEQYSINKLEYI